jgi:pimeloyl-ACP methyl ester carboxylesterase
MTSLLAPADKFLFVPANHSGYNVNSFKGNLFFLPPINDISYQIPCIIFPSPGSNILMIFSHGNGCDIGSYANYQEVAKHFGINILFWEYPGYGCCKGTVSASNIDKHFEQVMSFVRNVMKWPLSNIIFYGHSIGTGPTCKMVSTLEQKEKVGGMMLQSPYSSIRDMAKVFAGKLGYLIWERWNNLEAVKTINCPVMLIHGKKDNLIPYTHSEQLYAALPSKQKVIHLYEYANHNYFNPEDLMKALGQLVETVKETAVEVKNNDLGYLAEKYPNTEKDDNKHNRSCSTGGFFSSLISLSTSSLSSLTGKK